MCGKLTYIIFGLLCKDKFSAKKCLSANFFSITSSTVEFLPSVLIRQHVTMSSLGEKGHNVEEENFDTFKVSSMVSLTSNGRDKQLA